MSDSNEVVVVASMKVRPDSRDQVRAALMRQVVRVHAEEPGLSCSLHTKPRTDLCSSRSGTPPPRLKRMRPEER